MLNLLCDFSSVMRTIGYVLLAFVVLMIMVMIHETGHYTAGKLLGFQINEYSIGMGPKIFSKKKKNGEIFSLRLLPLGGYCAFEGEDEENENPRAFNRQKPWKRLIVLFSGALFNFISAILVCVILFGCYGETVATVQKVYEYAPQSNQLLQSGDIIYKVNGKTVYLVDDLQRYLNGDELTVTVLRPSGEGDDVVYSQVTLSGITKSSFISEFRLVRVDGEFTCDGEGRKLQIGDTVVAIDGHEPGKKGDFARYIEASGNETVTLTVSDGEQEFNCTLRRSEALSLLDVSELQPYTGIGMAVNYQRHRFSFGRALLRTVPYCAEVGLVVLRTLGGLLTGAVGIDQVGGPITTISMTSQVIQTGFANVLLLVVLISVNLGVFNLLPVPALDGCRMVFVIIEWIRRKPVSRKVEAYINGIGLIVLIVLMVLIDLLKL